MRSFVAASLLLAGAALAQTSTTVTSTVTSGSQTVTVTFTTTTSASSSGSAAASSTVQGAAASSSSSSTSAGTINALLQSQNATTFSTTASPTIGGKPETTLSLFNACNGPEAECNYSGLTYYGGIVSANPTATVFAIQCASSNNATACGDQAVTITQGASVYQRVQTQASPSAVISASCTIVDSTSQAVCVEAETSSPLSVGTVTAASAFVLATGSAIGLNANSANGTQGPATTTTMTFSSDGIFYNPLVITSGVELLSSSAPTNTPPSPSGKPSRLQAHRKSIC